MKHKILFVDDEDNILKALKRLLRKSHYEVFFENNGQDALKCIANNDISVLVTDMRMPNMNGIELIIEANKVSPMTIKTILSAYADIDDIMIAINSGHVHNYITKPWNESDLFINLMNATELYEKRLNEKKLIAELNKKNQELNELNSNLEQIVKLRTWDLHASNEILNSIIGGKKQNVIINNIINVLGKISGDKKVIIHDAYSNSLYGTEVFTKDSKILQTCIKKLKPSIVNSHLVIPLIKNEEKIGTILIGDVCKDQLHFTKRIKNIEAILIMYLSQKAMLANSNEVIGSIDMLLEGIDE